MNKESLFEKIKELYYNFVMRSFFKNIRNKYDMDFGKYPMEELYKLYLNHKEEIERH